MLADGDVLKHDAIYERPIYVALAYADKKIADARAQAAAYNTESADDG